MNRDRDIANSLGKAQRSGSWWMARCPTHEDKSPSLGIFERSDGSIALKCHAGCSTEEVRRELIRRGLWPKEWITRCNRR